MTANWLQTDEAEDVSGSIRHALRCGSLVVEDPQAWKWIALALHSALQGACVCHLTTTAAPIGAVTKRNAEDWLTFWEHGGDSPRTNLMTLPELLKVLRKAGSAGGPSNDARIVISDKELEWLRRFHETVRNQFVHFEPRGWSLEVSGIPAICVLVTLVIGQISEGGWAFRHKSEAWSEALRIDLEALRSPNWIRTS